MTLNQALAILTSEGCTIDKLFGIIELIKSPPLNKLRGLFLPSDRKIVEQYTNKTQEGFTIVLNEAINDTSIR